MYMEVCDLGDLVNTKHFTTPIDIAGVEPGLLLKLYKKMLKIRRTEEAIANLVIEKLARAPCHLAIGQEAISVGLAECFRTSDKAFGNHRSHGHFLSMGGSVRSLLCEVLGKANGCSRGMGGSMHLYGGDFGFVGSVPIVGGTIPLALGAGLAEKMKDEGNIAIAFFGDGAAEEGVLHESMNYASAHNIPLLFVCENNLFSSHLDIHLRQPANKVSRFAVAHMVLSKVIDGNDVVKVMDAAKEITTYMRTECKPAFIEAVTYRWRGHVGPNEDIDVGVRRSLDELKAWKKRDPIARLRDSILLNKTSTHIDLEKVDIEVMQLVEEAVEFAKNDEYPQNDALINYVYARTSR